MLIHDGEYDADRARELGRFGLRFSRLGDNIGEQIAKVLTQPETGNCWGGENHDEQGVNPHAIKRGAELLEGADDDVDAALPFWLAKNR